MRQVNLLQFCDVMVRSYFHDMHMIFFNSLRPDDMMHICIVNLTTIGSGNGLSPGSCQTIIWTNAGILLIGPPGKIFSEILIEIHTSSSKNAFVKAICKL